jgi:hypothetical protein
MGEPVATFQGSRSQHAPNSYVQPFCSSTMTNKISLQIRRLVARERGFIQEASVRSRKQNGCHFETITVFITLNPRFYVNLIRLTFYSKFYQNLFQNSLYLTFQKIALISEAYVTLK